MHNAASRAAARHHHSDRHFATHAVSFKRSSRSHVLLNGHPVYGNHAFAPMCMNEACSCAPPTFEMRRLAMHSQKYVLETKRREKAGLSRAVNL